MIETNRGKVGFKLKRNITKDDVIYTVENAGISGYSILGHTYAQKVLCYDTPQLQLGQAAYKGKNANGEDKIVIIFDRMDPDRETLEDFE